MAAPPSPLRPRTSPRSTPSWPPRTSCWSRTTRATTAPASPSTPSTSRPTASRRRSPPTGAPRRWPTAEAHGGLDGSAPAGPGPRRSPPPSRPACASKLASEPIEDLRLDFEDGYGDRGDDAEDAAAVAAPPPWPPPSAAGSAPPFIGIRFKCFEAPTRARGLRTLDLFVSGLAAAGELPEGLVLTLPKVTTVAQVEAMDYAVSRLEEAHSLPAGRLRFEVQVETPQLILGPDGTSPVAQLPHAVPGRISGLHYGTYDYSPPCRSPREYQSMEHPVADFAKEVMQLAVAGTGIRLSDGSTNIIPVGDGRARTPGGCTAGWSAARWNAATTRAGTCTPPSCPAASPPPTRSTGRAFPRSRSRLRNYVERTEGGVMDEPATARALAAFVLRGVQCGAVGAEEVQALAGLGIPPADRAGPPPAGHHSTTHTQGSPMSNYYSPARRPAAADPAHSPTGPSSQRPTR